MSKIRHRHRQKISLPFGRSERDSIIQDARSSEGKTPQERVAMFVDLLRLLDALWANLPPEDRRFRIQIADELDRRPEPWWKNLRPEAQPDFSCKNSSD